MKKYTISGDLIVPFVIEVEAAPEDDASALVERMSPTTLAGIPEIKGTAVEIDWIDEAE